VWNGERDENEKEVQVPEEEVNEIEHKANIT